MAATLRTIAALALLAACARSAKSPALETSDDAQACIRQLLEINRGLLEYTKRQGHPPEGSGTRFLAALIEAGVWPNDAAHARLLTCPGVAPEQLGLDPADPAGWYRDLDRLDGAHCAYAARDNANFPLQSYPQSGVQPVVACDNHGGMNHPGVTNVLYADGRVVSYELELEIASGHLPAGSTRVPIGPEAPEDLAELRRLSLD
jgi:prepilin-type processing-associated H-X9-DG protein